MSPRPKKWQMVSTSGRGDEQASVQESEAEKDNDQIDINQLVLRLNKLPNRRALHHTDPI